MSNQTGLQPDWAARSGSANGLGLMGLGAGSAAPDTTAGLADSLSVQFPGEKTAF